ncbi:MAG: hypothetical protein ABEH77_06870 [Halobacteriaceae archaeon]
MSIDLRVIRARPVFSDGRHNAFTGIARLDGERVIAFRSATDHLSGDGEVTVIGDDDGEWTVRTRLTASRPDDELRDPSLVTVDGELLVYTCASDSDVTPRRLVSMVATSTDGRHFSDPQPVGGIPDGEWLWEVREHDGTLYGTTHDGGASPPALYRSEDGRDWEPLLEFPDGGNEASIDIGADGRLWALVRDVAGPCPVVYSADPPYDQFRTTREKNLAGRVVPKRLQGPFVKRLAGGLVIIGREYDLYGGGKHNTRTNIWWRPDDSDPVLVRSLPSGGDTSYADWLDVEPGRALVSYYSGHTYRMDLPHDQDHRFEESRAYAEQNSPADIYLAEVAYPAERARRVNE